MKQIKTKNFRLKQKEDTVNENERGISFTIGFFFYTIRSYLVFGCKMGSFNFTNGKISVRKSTGIFNYLGNSDMNVVGNSKGDLPDLKNNGRMYVYLSLNHFQQNKLIIPNNNNVINIYCVYKLQPVFFSRNYEFTIQNPLFGSMKITKNTDTSKHKYKGCGICFNKGGEFTHTRKEGNFPNTTLARNVLTY